MNVTISPQPLQPLPPPQPSPAAPSAPPARQRPGASRTARSSRRIQAPRLRCRLALPSLTYRLRPAPR